MHAMRDRYRFGFTDNWTEQMTEQQVVFSFSESTSMRPA